MKTEDILTIEENGGNRINLVRDRLFWQAWNKSAFLFVTHIKKYHVHKRFVQKVAQEVAWLGFPKSEIVKIEQTAQANGWSFEQKSADHIIIDGVPSVNGYEKWWASIVKPVQVVEVGVGAGVAKKIAKASSQKQPLLLPAYKAAYDLCVNVHKSTVKISKEYRYELGARVRGYSLDIAETLHLMNNITGKHAQPSVEAIFECANVAHKLRIHLRVLHDLRQLSVKSWGFLNQQVEDLLGLLRAEFRDTNTRITGASHIQSGGTLHTTGLSPVPVCRELPRSYPLL